MLIFLGRAAAANPASKPIPPQVQPEPVVVETTQDVPSTSSKGKLIDTYFLSSIIQQIDPRKFWGGHSPYEGRWGKFIALVRDVVAASKLEWPGSFGPLT